MNYKLRYAYVSYTMFKAIKRFTVLFKNVSNRYLFYISNIFDLDFVINEKVISLNKVIKYLKDNQSSFSDYSANETIVHC